jgi:hypothetical protein
VDWSARCFLSVFFQNERGHNSKTDLLTVYTFIEFTRCFCASKMEPSILETPCILNEQSGLRGWMGLTHQHFKNVAYYERVTLDMLRDLKVFELVRAFVTTFCVCLDQKNLNHIMATKSRGTR